MGRQARRPFRRRLIPRVSFILPIHNVADTLTDTLDSIAAQTVRDFEVVMFDDGSSDRTAEIAADRADTDRRFCLVGSEKRGLVGALVAAVQASDGEFLARIDGDDLCRPKRLEIQIERLDADPGLAALGSRINSFSAAGPPGPGMQRYTEWLNGQLSAEQIRDAMFIESPMCHPSVTMRRSAYENSCGYVDDDHPEDYRLWLDFYASGQRMCKAPEVLLDWRDRPARLTRTDPRYGPERFMALKVAYLLKTHLIQRPPVTLWGAGKLGRRWSRALTRSGIEVVQFIDIDDEKIGRTVHGRPVVPIPRTPADIGAALLLLVVGSATARQRIEAHLTDIGLPRARTLALA